MGRELLASLGWAVFVGAGIALGLYLGSLGADVPADTGMLAITAVIAFSATLIARVLMVLFKYRPGQQMSAPRAAPRPRATQPPPPERPGEPAGSEGPGPLAPDDQDIAETDTASASSERATASRSRSRSRSGSSRRASSARSARSGAARARSARDPKASRSPSRRKGTPRRPPASTDDTDDPGED